MLLKKLGASNGKDLEKAQTMERIPTPAMHNNAQLCLLYGTHPCR
jgi:hypothetical protein